MGKNIQLLITLILFTAFTSKALCQNYSIRTNLFNLVAKGPSVTFGKKIKENSEILVTTSFGRFAPFFTVDSYKYATVHAEYRLKDHNYSDFKFYCGGYLRFIHKRILAEGFQSGPYGIFSRESRNFIGNGLSIGLTSGCEWSINHRWLLDFNTLFGAGKYLSQIDYAAHDKISVFFDTRISLQLGFRF